MTFTLCHGKSRSTHAIKNGKPSISIRAIYTYHGYVRNRGYLQDLGDLESDRFASRFAGRFAGMLGLIYC